MPLYTPLQVRTASFFGGPFAAVYALHQNFKQLGDSAGMKRTLQLGTAFCVGLVAISPALPYHFPKILVPVLYSIAAGEIAKAKHLSRDKIDRSDRYRPHSAWRVAGVSVVGLLAFSLFVLSIYFVLDITSLVNFD